jgi:DNA-binding transcriptional ArsR family regulator
MVEPPHRLDAVFQALADPTRRAMLHELAEGERTISQLAGPHRMSFAGASKHVKVLERAGLLRRTVRGRAHVCSLAPEPLVDVNDWLRFYRRLWTQRPGPDGPGREQPGDAALRGARGEEGDG